MNKLFILVIIILTFSCKKKALNKVHPEMQGYWKHWNSDIEYQILLINEHGAGKISIYVNGERTIGDVTRGWYIKDDYLIWTWKGTVKTNGYKIDQYPTIATSQFINELDTVYKGNYYIKLNGKIYVDRTK